MVSTLLHGLIAVIALAAVTASAHDPRPRSSAFDERALPHRDGNRSDEPRRNHVMSCKKDFSNGRGAVAMARGLRVLLQAP